MTPLEIQRIFETVKMEMGKVIVGQDDLVEGVMLALFSHGHVLIEGPPGLGKTLLVNTLATVLDCDSRRVQCTPDLMPGDLVGHSVFDMKEQRFIYRQGPVFTNILLADEVNRATPKTQSAMLECLQERQVSVDGKTYPIEPPFVTLATQNPLEYEGTYPLPEAQVDRFMFKLLVGYPSIREETLILARYQMGKNLFDMAAMGVRKMVSKQLILETIDACTAIDVSEKVLGYIASIVTKTRDWPGITVGASPRASVAMLMGARAAAAVLGREYVTPDDARRIAPWCLRHRIRLSPDSVIRGVQPDDVLKQLFDSVEVPRE
ncbi:MAG: MoxR family ATPase [Deltaproteobacteria bacterium]|nr:MoxR family ATPase [Deltaproteobacteria bacterium]